VEVSWTDRFPDQAALRAEVRALVEAFVEVILARIPHDEIAAIYFKGSARKQWDSPLDYVPEISDVDIHLLMRNEGDVERRLGAVAQTLPFAADVERAYLAKVKSPLHFPRPQVTIVNKLLSDPDYCPSPKETVETLYGEEYPAAAYADEAALGELCRRRILDDASAITTYPTRVMDRPGRYMWEIIRDLNWRVSPTGPRVLSVRGVPTREAWSLNRTHVVRRLRDVGETELAAHYRGYYLSGWDYFLSGLRDTDAGRRLVAAGVAVLARGLAIAQDGNDGAGTP